MSGVGRYRELFSVPGIPGSVVPALAGKLMPGMYGLSLLMLLSRHLEYGVAAWVASGAAWGSMTTPVRGRLLDRFSYGRVLLPLLVLHLGCLILLMVGVQQGFSPVGLFAVVLCASLVMPPVGVVTRVMWRARATPSTLPTALALDAVLTDLGFMVGPVLVVGLGHRFGAGAGIVAGAVAVLVAVPLLVRNAKGIARTPSSGGSPWRRSGVRWVFLVASLFFFGVGLMETVLASQGSGREVTLSGGAVLSIVAVASVVGGLSVGGLPTHVAERVTRPVVTIGAIAAAMLLLAVSVALADRSVFLACIPVGLCLGPCFVAVHGAAGRAAAPGEQAETQAWVASALTAGGALGTSVGGWTLQHHGPATALALGAVMMALGAAAGLATET